MKIVEEELASLLAQSMKETENAEQLHADQFTVSRDIKALKEISQRFLYDLAQSDLAYYYKQCLDGIDRRSGSIVFVGATLYLWHS